MTQKFFLLRKRSLCQQGHFYSYFQAEDIYTLLVVIFPVVFIATCRSLLRSHNGSCDTYQPKVCFIIFIKYIVLVSAKVQGNQDQKDKACASHLGELKSNLIGLTCAWRFQWLILI